MQLDIAERRSTCGRTLAIVVAAGLQAVEEVSDPFGGGEVSVACATVDAVCWAQTAYVFVVASPEISETVTRQVHLAKRGKNAPLVQVVECDAEAIQPIIDASDREVVDALIGASPVECDTVLVVEAALPLISGEQVFSLCCNGAADVSGAYLVQAS